MELQKNEPSALDSQQFQYKNNLKNNTDKRNQLSKKINGKMLPNKRERHSRESRFFRAF
jgi:hypothetical protein